MNSGITRAGDTQFGAITYRGAASLRSTLFRLRMTARSDEARVGYAWLFQAAIGAYAWVYLRLSLAVRRRQELEADAEAAAAVGPEVTAQALRAVHALGITWAGFESRYLRPVQRLGFVPEDVFEAFTAMVGDPLVRERMAELRAHPVESGRSPLDSHPPLARRLALIEAMPAGPRGTVVEEGPLVADPSPVPRVQRRMLGEFGHSATALPRTEWADLAAEAFAIELASLLLDAASDSRAIARPTLATVLGLLERGEQTQLIRRLTDAPEPEEQLAEALYALTGQALATRAARAGCSAGPRATSWTAPRTRADAWTTSSRPPHATRRRYRPCAANSRASAWTSRRRSYWPCVPWPHRPDGQPPGGAPGARRTWSSKN